MERIITFGYDKSADQLLGMARTASRRTHARRGTSPLLPRATFEMAMELAPDRYRYALEWPILEPPSVTWTYCGGATALLGRLIADGTGRPLPQYGRTALFAPLSIDSFEWMAGADGVASAASGLRLAPRDLARVGELVLMHGAWDGRQIVPANWIRAMLQPRLQPDWGGRYGYHWYLETIAGHRLVAGMGNGGERLIALPDPDLTVAITAGNYDNPDQWRTRWRCWSKSSFPRRGNGDCRPVNGWRATGRRPSSSSAASEATTISSVATPPPRL